MRREIRCENTSGLPTEKDFGSESPSHLRQMIIASAWSKGSERLILVCKAPFDMTTSTEEAVRLTIDDFPAIGIVGTNGKVSVNTEYCLSSGLYENLEEIALDLQMALSHCLPA